MSSHADSATQRDDALTTSTTPALPLEVCERIIDFCAHFRWYEQDARILPACALTSRGWLPRSRLHLYYTISLQHERHFVRLFRTIRGTPPLGTFVRQLNLGVRPEKVDSKDCKDSEASVTAPPRHSSNWMLQVPLFLPLLPLLRLIQFWGLPTFNGITQIFFTRFKACRTVTRISLRYCYLASFQDLVRFLSHFPSVEHLFLAETVIANQAPPIVGHRYLRSFPPFSSVDLWDVADNNLLGGIISLSFWRSIRQLRFICNRATMVAAMEKLLPICSPMLEGCTISLCEEGGWYWKRPDSSNSTQLTLPASIDLASALKLQRIHLCIRLLPGAERCLDILKLPATIATVKLAFLLSTEKPLLSLSLSWDVLDSQLTDKEYKLLSAVEIILHEGEISDGERDGLHQGMASVLPKIRKRGVLTVHYRTHDLDRLEALWK